MNIKELNDFWNTKSLIKNEFQLLYQKIYQTLDCYSILINNLKNYSKSLENIAIRIHERTSKVQDDPSVLIVLNSCGEVQTLGPKIDIMISEMNCYKEEYNSLVEILSQLENVDYSKLFLQKVVNRDLIKINTISGKNNV